MITLDVSLLPNFGNTHFPLTLNNANYVIAIDVLRATTTIATALEYGVKEVIPMETVEESLQLYEKLQSNGIFLGGERKNVKPQKFHFGNSPFEYQNTEVSNKKLIFTTTNGTKLLHSLKEHKRIILGCFRNVSTISMYIQKSLEDFQTIFIACAGSNGVFSFDDVLCAGAFIQEFVTLNATNIQLTDTAKVAKMLYNQTENTLIDFVKNTSHGIALIENGFEKDIDFCFEKNVSTIIPLYENKIVKAL